MVFKISSENVRKTMAMLSILVSMLVIVFENSVTNCEIEQTILKHICLLQIFASVLLYIGSRNANQWFFLPWLLVAFAFAYALVYKSLVLWHNLKNEVKHNSLLISLLYVTAGCWFYFIHAVYVDFQDIQIRARQVIL